MIRRRHVLPSVSLAEISPEVAELSRRRLLRNGLSLGSLALLTGCDLSTHSGIDAALWAMLRSGRCCASMIACSRRYIIRSALRDDFGPGPGRLVKHTPSVE